MQFAQDFNRAQQRDISVAVEELSNPTPLRFLCGLFRRYDASDDDVAVHTAPVSMTSLCETKESPLSGATPYLVVVKEIYCASSAATAMPHIHPLMRLQHLRKRIASQRAIIAQLEACKLMSFVVIEQNGGRGRGGSSHSVDMQMGESLNGHRHGGRSTAVVAMAHVDLHEATCTMFQFQEYIPAQTLEQLLQLQVLPEVPPPLRPTSETEGVTPPDAPATAMAGAGATVAAATSGGGNSGGSDPASSSGQKRNSVKYCRKLPVATVVTAIFKGVLALLRELHVRNIPHLHIRPTSVLIAMDAAEKGAHRYNVWLDNVNSLCTRSPLQDADVWRWYAPEVTFQDLGDAEVFKADLADDQLQRWKKADIFSVGLLLNFMLTGCCPFEGLPLAQMLGSRTQEDAFSKSGLSSNHYTSRLNTKTKTRNPHGTKLEEIVRSCVAWLPSERPTVEELLREIEEVYHLNPDVEQLADEDDVASQMRESPVPQPQNPPRLAAVPEHFGHMPPNPLVADFHRLVQNADELDNGAVPSAPDGSGGEREEPVAAIHNTLPLSTSANIYSGRIFAGVHSSSTDRRHQSGDRRHQSTSSHMLVRSGAQVQFAGTLADATPLDRGMFSVVGGVSQGGASKYFGSQLNPGVDYEVQNEQLDGKELLATILEKCFGDDAEYHERTGNNAQTLLGQTRGTYHWRQIAIHFSNLAAKGYYPHRVGNETAFQQHSLVYAFWYGRHNGFTRDKILQLDKKFLAPHIKLVQSSENGPFFGGSGLNMSNTVPTTMRRLQAQFQQSRERGSKITRSHTLSLLSPWQRSVADVGAHVQASVSTAHTSQMGDGDAYEGHPIAQRGLMPDVFATGYRRFLQRRFPRLLANIRITIVMLAVWATAAVVAALCTSLR